MKKKNRKAEKEDESALEGNLWIETVHWNWKKYKHTLLVALGICGLKHTYQDREVIRYS